MRWPNRKALAIAALGISLAGLTPAPAMASKLFGVRILASRYEAVPRWYRRHPCRGRVYTYLAGWGCDYYRYSWDWPKGRR